jgi:hypothetical protein
MNAADCATADPGCLGDIALASLRFFFRDSNHHPSPDQWHALEDIAATLDNMANGTCAPSVFLSSLDPGVGKSSTVEHFARALLASPDHGHVGMVVCVARIAEAVTLAEALADRKAKVAVWTTDEAANAAGGCPPEEADRAQLLITTQQRIERATDGRAFGDVERFRFNGRPRLVRVWDEAWLPGRAIDLNEDDVAFLLKPIRRLSAEFHHDLRSFFLSLGDAATGSLIDVPDWQHRYGIGLYDVLAAIAGPTRRSATTGGPDKPTTPEPQGLRDDQRDAATSIFALAGKSARVWRNNYDGSAVLSYRDTLPEDLKPLLVLDASGRVRETYAQMVRHRGLVRLRAAVKDYTPLRLHWWRRGGGKASFADHGDDLASGIVATILTEPAERWLVVVHRRDPKVRDVQGAITARLPADVRGNIAFTTWGNHVATNAHADVPNLILAGTLFMRPSHYVALTHLAQDRPTAPGFADKEDVERTTQGEHANLILQAICRGRVRKSDGPRCLPMDAYLIADPRSGIGDVLPTIFPGATMLPWEPLKAPLKGHLATAVAFAKDAFARGEQAVTYAAIRAHLGIDRRNLGRLVTSRPEWSAAVADLGAEVVMQGRRGASGLRMSSSVHR